MSDIATAEITQPSMLDMDGQSLNAMWVDEKQSLFLPNNPLHWKAHKLQVLLSRLDKQAERNPAQFNSTTYVNVLNEYTKCCEAINGGKDEVLDKGGVASDGDAPAATEDSEIEPISMDFGIPANDPIPR